MTQVAHRFGDNLDSARPADLLVLWTTSTSARPRCGRRSAGLEQTLATRSAGGGSSGAALAEAKARLAALSIQVGTAPATGPGVES